MDEKTQDVGFKKTAAQETLYEGGAQRDSRNGKGAPEWMPGPALALVSCIYERGNKGRTKTGDGHDRNWENGMGIADLIGSGMRHTQRYLEGDRSEPHLPMAIWNLLNALMMSIWVYLGFRSEKFNNLPDHIHPWKPGDPSPCPLSPMEIEWLKVRGIEKAPHVYEEKSVSCVWCGDCGKETTLQSFPADRAKSYAGGRVYVCCNKGCPAFNCVIDSFKGE